MEDEKELDTQETVPETPVEVEEPQYTEAERKSHARAKVAEAEAKELKIKLKALEDKKPNSPVNSDELRLLAKGLSDEEIEEAKSIAKGKDISLPEAIKTKAFQLFQTDLKETQRKESAKLGASKGSGQEEETNVAKSGMTAEEHKALWNKSQGR